MAIEILYNSKDFAFVVPEVIADANDAIKEEKKKKKKNNIADFAIYLSISTDLP